MSCKRQSHKPSTFGKTEALGRQLLSAESVLDVKVPNLGAPSLDAHPLDGVDHSLSSAAFGNIAKAIHGKTAAMAEAIGAGEVREFRSLRTAEISEISGLNYRQIREWRRENRNSLKAYSGKSYTGPEHLPQLPLALDEMHRLMADHGVLPCRPKGARAIRMGCFNFKGGSTKTTTVLNLATYFAMHGWRTLAVDADPQGSLSTMFGHSPEYVSNKHTLFPAFKSASSQELFDSMTLLPLRTHVSGLDILPANLDMIGADFDVTAAFMDKAPAAKDFYNCVDAAFRTIEDDYDIILIDGPPAFSFTALATMWAADGMIIPVPPASPDFKATAAFCAMASAGLMALAERAGCPDRVWSPVTFFHSRAKSKSQSAEIIRSLSKEVFGRFRSGVSIADSAVIPNATSRQMSVWETTANDVDRRGLRSAREAYGALGAELVFAIQAAWQSGCVPENR